MTGWLIVNEYLNTEKFKELQKLFMDAAVKEEVHLEIHTNAEFVVDYESGDALSDAFINGLPSFVIFYDKDISLAIALENMGVPVFNSAGAIEACDSKALSAEGVCAYNQACADTEDTDDTFYISKPLTFKVPFTYENIGINESADFKFLNIVENKIEEKTGSSYPMILKECFSSFGMGVYKAENRDEMIALICRYGSRECIIQEYINASGSDVRLQMVGDECVAAMMRSNDSDFRSNLTNGGVMNSYNPTDEDIMLARAVMRSLSLDFAGIDIMHDQDGKPVFCEANSNAHFKNLFDLTGINVAEAMIKYIKESI